MTTARLLKKYESSHTRATLTLPEITANLEENERAYTKLLVKCKWEGYLYVGGILAAGTILLILWLHAFFSFILDLIFAADVVFLAFLNQRTSGKFRQFAAINAKVSNTAREWQKAGSNRSWASYRPSPIVPSKKFLLKHPREERQRFNFVIIAGRAIRGEKVSAHIVAPLSKLLFDGEERFSGIPPA